MLAPAPRLACVWALVGFVSLLPRLLRLPFCRLVVRVGCPVGPLPVLSVRLLALPGAIAAGSGLVLLPTTYYRCFRAAALCAFLHSPER